MAFNGKILGDRLKDLGMKQSDLVARIQLEHPMFNRRTVGRWIKGETQPRREFLAAMANALGCDPRDLDSDYTSSDPNRVTISAMASVAAHNGYELMKLRYNVSQRDLIELAPVLFSIVAQLGLNLPEDEAKREAQAATLLGRSRELEPLPEEKWRRREADEAAAMENLCFGKEAPEDDPEFASRNLFHEAVRNLIAAANGKIAMGRGEAGPGEPPGAACFNVDTEIVEELSGGDQDVAQAIITGRLQLSKFIDTAEMRLRDKDTPLTTAFRDAMLAGRNANLEKLHRWEAYFHEKSPEISAEYDRMVAEFCNPPEWYHKRMGPEDIAARTYDPFQFDERFIDARKLPEFDPVENKRDFLHEWKIGIESPTVHRFKELQILRNEIKREFGEAER